MSQTIKIGKHEMASNAFLAPMSGITDLPFRRMAQRFGAGLVISEMIASESLAKGDPDAVRKMAGGEEIETLVIQLAGREGKWMAEGARLAADAGAAIIDINMGCPARKVTNGLSGSALMRDIDHAESLIKATVDAVDVPVTLKMRLGWDDDSLNAPELAKRAQDLGVHLITVHGRTRCQFYKGEADWVKVSHTVAAIDLPVIVNGDILSVANAKEALEKSKAHGVMIGRGAIGQPWLFAEFNDNVDVRGINYAEIILEHYDDILSFYGDYLGLRCARKHLAEYVDKAPLELLPVERSELRKRVCTAQSPDAVKALIKNAFADHTICDAA